MTQTPILQCKNMVMRFGGLVATNDVSFNVYKGEILCLMGPNGAGKSTILNMVTGIYRPTSGSLQFNGLDLTKHAPYDIVAHGIARTFQNSRLFSDLSVLDNVMIGMHTQGRTGVLDAFFRPGRVRREMEEAAEKAGELLQAVSEELYEQKDRPASDLAQADRRRLEIARALASKPKLILLDEPSAGMDDKETRALVDDIRRVHKAQPDLSFIIIEHDMQLVADLPDRIIVLDYGTKIAEGTFEEVCAVERVQEAYLGGAHA